MSFSCLICLVVQVLNILYDMQTVQHIKHMALKYFQAQPTLPKCYQLTWMERFLQNTEFQLMLTFSSCLSHKLLLSRWMNNYFLIQLYYFIALFDFGANTNIFFLKTFLLYVPFAPKNQSHTIQNSTVMEVDMTWDMRRHETIFHESPAYKWLNIWSDMKVVLSL